MKGLLLVIILLFTFLTCLGLFFFRNYLGIDDVFSLLIYVISIFLILFVFLLVVPLFIKVQWISLLEKIYIKNEGNKEKKVQNDKFKILRNKIKNSNKIIVGIIGEQEVIDLSFPNLTQKLYIEDKDYLYVYALEANKKWLNFRGCGKRVFDSVLYVTSPNFLYSEDYYDISTFINNIGMIISVNITCIVDHSFNKDAVCYSYKLNHKDFNNENLLKEDIVNLIDNLKCAVVCEVENSTKYSHISSFLQEFAQNAEKFCGRLFSFVKKSKSKNIISRITFIDGGVYNNNIKGCFISPNTIYKKNVSSFFDYCCLSLVALACLWVWIGFTTIKDVNKEYKNIEEQLQYKECLGIDEIIKNNQIINNDSVWSSLSTQVKILPFLPFTSVFNEQKSYLTDKYVSTPFYNLLSSTLELKLKSLSVLNEYSEKNKNDLYNSLKLYLILGKHKELNEQNFVKEQLLYLLPCSKKEELLSVLKQSLTLSQNKDFILDNRIIATARSVLLNQNNALLDIDKYYENLKLEAHKIYIPQNLSSLLKSDVSLVWDSSETLDGIYSKEAWENFFSVKLRELDKKLSKDLDWVIIDIEEQEDSSIVKQMKAKYFGEYIDNWLSFLNSINWINSSSINESIAQINKYTARNNSCLINLLKIIAYNTNLRKVESKIDVKYLKVSSKFKEMESKVSSAVKEYNTRDFIEESNNEVDEVLLYKTFEPIASLLNDVALDNGSSTYYDYTFNIRQYMEKLVYLKRRMYLISSSSNASKEAINYVLSSHNLANNNEFSEGISFATLLEEQIGVDFIPFSQAVFKGIFANSWDNITVPAQKQLNSLWQQQVYKIWKDELSQKYPFVASENEVSFSLIKKFFNPNKGTYYSFINKYLNNFVDLSEEDFTYSDEQNINFSYAFYKSFDYCNNVSRIAFLNADGVINFELRPLGGVGITESELIIDGEKIKYFNQVATWKKISWPKSNAEKLTKLSWTQEKTGVSRHITFKGDWGFLRLLEMAKIEQLEENLYILTFSVEDGFILQYKLKTEYLGGPLEFLKAKTFKMPKNIID